MTAEVPDIPRMLPYMGADEITYSEGAREMLLALRPQEVHDLLLTARNNGGVAVVHDRRDAPGKIAVTYTPGKWAIGETT